MNKIARPVFAGLLLFFLQSTSYAGLIAYGHYDFQGGLRTDGSPEVTLKLFNGTDQSAGSSITLFNEASPSNGETYTLSSVNGAIFSQATQILTNGINDSFSVSTVFNSGALSNGGSEAEFFYGDSSGISGIDLTSYVIDRIALTIDAIFYQSPGSNPNSDGLWKDVALFTTISFYGEGVPISQLPQTPRHIDFSFYNSSNSVPEPRSIILVLLGLLILAYSKRKVSLIYRSPNNGN